MSSFLSYFRDGQFTPKVITVLQDGYRLSDFKTDFLAGLTVAIVALPLAMALAIASGASPDKGLLTAVVAGVLISLLGGSRVQIGGPTGAFVVVVYAIIADHGYDGLVLATLLAGVILIMAGYARLGQVIRFIPHSVITGFTAGIAVIIATSQVKDFLGLQIQNVPSDFILKWAAYGKALPTVDAATALMGIASVALILGLRRFAPRLPGYLLAVVFGVCLVYFFHAPVDTIGSRFPDLPTGIPVPGMPDFSFAKVKEMMPSAFIIAFLAGIEALLSAVVADGMTGYRHRPNQELVGQGVANVASALFGGLPATGAIARTATNIKSGGKTPVAGVLHGVFVLLFMLYAMDLVRFIPMAALAAVLFIVAWGMSEVRHFRHILSLRNSDSGVLVLTFLLTVLVDLTVAIAVGVTLASLLFMVQMSRSVQMGTKADPELVKEGEEEDQRDDLPPGVEVFRIAGPVFFGVASDLIDTLRGMGQMPRVLIVRMRLVPFLDASGVHAIADVIDQCTAAGTHVVLSALQEQPGTIVKKSGLDKNPMVHVRADYDAALEYAATPVASVEVKT